MKRLFLLTLAAASLYSQTLKPSVPAHIEFTLSNTDPVGPCSNPTIFYFNFVNSAMWGCQISPNTFMGTWVQQNPSVGGGVTSVNGQTGVVALTIPTDNAQLDNGAGYTTAGQIPGLSAVQSINGNTGVVNIPIPTLLSQLVNDLNLINATQAPVLSVNGLTGAVTLPSANNYQTVQVNSAPVTQRAKVNFAAGANTTITPTDNGTDTTTLTIASTGGGGGGLPDPGANGVIKRTALNTTSAAVNGTDYYGPGFVIADADLPNTITSSITGNAGTATALQTAPSACAGGQFIQQIGANGNPVSCGVAVTGGPSFTSGASVPIISNCNSTTKGAAYQQTGVTINVPNGGGNMLWVCSSTGSSVNSGFNWIPITAHQVNAMAFGCAANGTTDDTACIQAAINLAANLNQYTAWDNGPDYMGNVVYLPCGDYGLKSPLIIPRGGGLDPYTATIGTVGLVGENSTCTMFNGISGSGYNGVDGVLMTNVGSSYTSAPTVTFTGGGCGTEPVGLATVQAAGSSIAFVNGVYLTNYGSGCTSMPTCTITGGGGSGATCQAIGRAMIEWAHLAVGTYKRTIGNRIENLFLRIPNQDGVVGIHFQSDNPPINTSPQCNLGYDDVCERLENATFSHLNFIASNDTSPGGFILSGDCNTCTVSYLSMNASGGSGTFKYQTPLIATTLFNGSIKDEADGFQYGSIGTLSCGGDKGGSAPCFQGRIQRTSLHDTFCDGIRFNTPSPICYAFYNSAIANLQNIGNEGNVGIQMQLENSQHFIVENLGIGSPLVTNSQPPIGGLSLLGSSENTFRNLYSTSRASYSTWGFVVQTDSTSYQNSFTNYQIIGTNEVSLSNTASTYMRYCITTSTCNTNVPFSTIGTAPF